MTQRNPVTKKDKKFFLRKMLQRCCHKFLPRYFIRTGTNVINAKMFSLVYQKGTIKAESYEQN